MGILERKKNMVDIGCGNGFLLEEAIKYGWENVSGVELSEKAINCAKPYVKQKIINKPFYADHFLENYFDLVFSAMVIEHITDINKFFSDVIKILRPGGVQVIIAHNEGHFLSRILKNKQGLILMTAHLGNWEALIPILSSYKKITVVVKEQRNSGGDRFVHNIRNLKSF